MKRVVILGRGGAGKSTLATQLGKVTGLPVIELDKYFWKTDLKPTSKDEWIQVQQKLTSGNKWVMDGDLGKYDVLETRLEVADTVIILDYSLARCVVRTLRRSKEKADFWWWLITWRWLSRPKLRRTIAALATKPETRIFRNPKALERFTSSLEHKSRGFTPGP